MGSTFGRGRDDPERLHLSNGGTTVFLDVLALAACELCRTEFERGFAVMLCNARLGFGNDDFDLDELPWSERWRVESAFVLRVVQVAKTRFRWGLLGYDPPYVLSYLGKYEVLVHGYGPPGERSSTVPAWDESPPESAFERCPRHGLFTGRYDDCRLCL